MMRPWARRLLTAVALALIVWGTLGLATADFRGALAAFKLGPSQPFRLLILGSLCLAAHFIVFGWAQLDADVAWICDALRLARIPVVVLACVFTFELGVLHGTFSASGSDSYGYVSQADLWLRRDLRIEQPFVPRMPWPNADWTFTPLAYRPAVDGHAIVSTVAPGLPILMAIFKRLAGSCGVYYVVPLFGALGVWACYALGARVESPPAGATAAIVLATSPMFLAQLIFPWTDVPAAACWTAALYFMLRATRTSALAAGSCAALAIAIRPNLVPLAAIPCLYLFRTGRDWRAFIAGVMPGIGLVAAVNAYLYGSPLVSGYGDLGVLFSWRNLPVNADRYGGWLVESQTPLIALAVVALARPGSTIRWWLAAFAAAVFVSYLFYLPFDKWWFVRFLLPALPALIVLMAGCALWLLGHVPRLAQALVWSCGLILLVAHQLHFAATRAALFDWKPHEHRYVVAGRYIAASTPPEAVIFSMQHSGSVRHYSGRLTLRYDLLPPEWLDRAIASLRQQGFRPYFLLEEGEVPVFKDRFGPSNEAGRLPWPPIASSTETIPVHLYEPRAASGSEGPPVPMPWIDEPRCGGR